VNSCVWSGVLAYTYGTLQIGRAMLMDECVTLDSGSWMGEEREAKEGCSNHEFMI
jgi:hypothetical protein